MGVSLAPIGLAYLIGVPISGATLGSDRAWWKGVTLASVSAFSIHDSMSTENTERTDYDDILRDSSHWCCATGAQEVY